MKKKILSILLMIALMAGTLVGLTACGDNDSKESSSSSSPETVVKEFIKNVEGKKADKIVKQIDMVGIAAWNSCYGDYEDYDDNYEDYQEEYDDLDKDEVEEYLDSLEEEMQEEFDYIDKIKIEIKKINDAEKVEDTKNLYSVNAKLKVSVTEDDDTETDTTTVDFYLMKKGGKYYIVGMDTISGNGLDIF